MTSGWFLYFLLVFIILKIPKINVFFRVLNTMFHEMGHALVCLFFKGKVVKISLFPNTEGEIITVSGGWIGRVLTSYAGYTFPLVATYVCFYFIGKGEYLSILYGFIGVALVNLLLWVRNLFGVFWLVMFTSFCSFFAYIEHSGAIKIFVEFLAILLLVEAVRSAFIICLLSFQDRKKAGDATSLAKSTFIPAFFWGLLFFVQSLLISLVIFDSFMR